MSYIMHPNLYYDLQNVAGFIELNGKTYQEHICIIFNNTLNDKQKNKIKNFSEDKDALSFLKTVIDFTHVFGRVNINY